MKTHEQIYRWRKCSRELYEAIIYSIHVYDSKSEMSNDQRIVNALELFDSEAHGGTGEWQRRFDEVRPGEGRAYDRS